MIRLPGWRLHRMYKLHRVISGRNHHRGCTSAAECAFEYGVPEACSVVRLSRSLSEILQRTEPLIGNTSEYQRLPRLSSSYSGFNAIFRTELRDHKDVGCILKWAKEQPGYPNNDFGANVAQSLQKNLESRTSGGKRPCSN